MNTFHCLMSQALFDGGVLSQAAWGRDEVLRKLIELRRNPRYVLFISGQVPLVL